MKKTFFAAALIAAGIAIPWCANAQLSHNPDKFLGNITTSGQVNGGGIEFATLWNQLTAENESKWASVEGSRDRYNWQGCDNCYNYCKKHNIPFKFHTLVWGSQYPSWMDNISETEQYEEIIEWLDAIKARYPDLPLIDVVNEAVPGHAPAPFKNALGGDGVTGYDWIIKAFELAHERWPDAILIYNDYNTFQWQRNEFINLVSILRDAGAPIDAYGCQSHDLTDISFSDFKSAMSIIQNALQMPMYSTEYDIGTADDQKQLRQYRDQIKYMWEQPYVAGITLWGYIYGRTWVTDGNSGIIKNGQDRPAMTWLREYMASDEANSAVGPFPGGVKEASVYIRPATTVATINEPLEVTVDARLRTHTINHIDFYLDGNMVQTLTDAPYIYTFTPDHVGRHDFKAIVYDTEGTQYQRIGGVNVYSERKSYLDVPVEIPGVIEAENFDRGGEGLTFHDSDNRDEGGVKYRTDNGGLDITFGNGGYVVGYTAGGEWMEYTVNFTRRGRYEFDAVVSSGLDGAAFSIGLVENGNITDLTGRIDVPNGGTWDTYTTVHGKINKRIADKGDHVLRISILGSYLNIDKIELIYTTAGIDDITDSINDIYEIYTTTGIKLGEVQLEDLDNVNHQVYDVTHQSGIYVLRSISTGESKVISVNP